MSLKKMDFVNEIAEKTGFPKVDVMLIIEEFIDALKDGLRMKERIEIRGFGVFKDVVRKSKIARNPKTMEEIVLPDRLVPTFRPSEKFRKEIESMRI